jgi:flavin reductase (DIM6/NTAB) family NADH-FMN oxidoreductase RutF
MIILERKMAKKTIEPSTLLVPLPAVLVTCGETGGKPNIITIAWCGIVCSKPPMLSISIKEDRHSFDFINRNKEFVVNITAGKMVDAVDFCGSFSGKDHDKFKEAGLTPLPANLVKAPLIKESPINLECQVRQTFKLGSHHMFIAEIVATHVEETALDKKGNLDIKKVDPLIYCTNARQYWSGLSKVHGYHGYTKKAKGG